MRGPLSAAVLRPRVAPQREGPRRATERAPEAARPYARHVLVAAGGGRAAGRSCPRGAAAARPLHRVAARPAGRGALVVQPPAPLRRARPGPPEQLLRDHERRAGAQDPRPRARRGSFSLDLRGGGGVRARLWLEQPDARRRRARAFEQHDRNPRSRRSRSSVGTTPRRSASGRARGGAAHRSSWSASRAHPRRGPTRSERVRAFAGVAPFALDRLPAANAVAGDRRQGIRSTRRAARRGGSSTATSPSPTSSCTHSSRRTFGRGRRRRRSRRSSRSRQRASRTATSPAPLRRTTSARSHRRSRRSRRRRRASPSSSSAAAPWSPPTRRCSRVR